MLALLGRACGGRRDVAAFVGLSRGAGGVLVCVRWLAAGRVGAPVRGVRALRRTQGAGGGAECTLDGLELGRELGGEGWGGS